MKRIFDSEMYNNDVKLQFLEPYSAATKTAFERVFRRSALVEKQLDKDVYDFNRDELKQVLSLMNPNKLSTSKGNANVLRAYINWAIGEGYRSSNINPLVSVAGEWYEQFIDKSKKTIFSKNEVDGLINYLVNEQDQAIVIGLFEGIRPDEFLGIKPLEHIDIATGMIKLCSKDGGARTAQFTDKCISILMRAFRQEKYLKSNGKTSSLLISSSESNLIDTGYLLKIANTSNKGEMPDSTLFYRKLKIIQNVSDDFKYINPANLRYSGMLYRAYELYKRDGELGRSQLNEICEEYDVPKIVSHMRKGQEVMGFKRFQFMSEFLNMETLKEVYLDIK